MAGFIESAIFIGIRYGFDGVERRDNISAPIISILDNGNT
jgi:hypothetical protein